MKPGHMARFRNQKFGPFVEVSFLLRAPSRPQPQRRGGDLFCYKSVSIEVYQNKLSLMEL